MSTPERQQGLVDDYAARLDRLADAAVANTDAALRRALLTMLADLKKWYPKYLDATQESAAGGRVRGATIAETASRFEALVKAAQAFLDERELQALSKRFQDDLAEAITLGGELGLALQENVSSAIARQFGRPNEMAVWTASQITTAYIRSETMRFRSQVTQIITEAAARGTPYRQMRKAIEDALLGSTDPDGITQRLGLRQRAELIARSEMVNAYVETQRRASKASGFEYVQWIAARDERTCPLCVSRHGQIYRVDEVVAPAHPRCRCSLSPVMSEAVEEKDPTLRRDLLDGDYWIKSQKQARAELKAAKGWDDARVDAELSKALRKVTPSERYRTPDVTETVSPVVGL